MSQFTLMEELITNLREINYPKGYESTGKYEGLGDVINRLSQMDKNLAPDFVASAFVHVISRFQLETDENSELLRAFGREIPCKHLYFTEYTRQLFFGTNNPPRITPSKKTEPPQPAKSRKSS